MDDDERKPFEERLIAALNEVKLMQAGLMPKRTWDELKAELEQEFAAELEDQIALTERSFYHGRRRTQTF